ncbi:MAG: putative glycoside hydrolase [Gemmatimonadetes bacterium]|nr:putative glycoside hydrolase [Gemmatimonadota bacterium]
MISATAYVSAAAHLRHIHRTYNTMVALVFSRLRPLTLSAGLFLLTACGGQQAESRTTAQQPDTAVAAASADTAAERAAAAPTQTPRSAAPPIIRGIYLNAYAAGSSNRLGRLLEIAENTEINAFVVDVKDEKGIHYRGSEVALANELAQPGELTIRDLKAFADTLRARNVYSIARIVVFKDPGLAQAKPEWSIRTPDGGLWRDRAGNHWVSPWDPNVWEYNIQIAEEVARAGFDEIQFDYIRFPEPYRRTLPPQVHRHAQGDRTDAVAAFLNTARDRIHPLGAPVGVDLFGLSPNTFDDVDIGQQWETLVAAADHVLPMVYPSHYLATHLPGVSNPNQMPYETVYKSLGMAVIRNERMRQVGVEPARLIPWLQAFTATWINRSNPYSYGPEQFRAQVRGVYDVGLEDWILWNAASRYDQMSEAFGRSTESRAKQWSGDPELNNLIDQFERRGVLAARERAAEQAAGRTTNREAAAAARSGDAGS